MPASLELVKIALQAYGSGDVEIALALSDPMVRWDERASRPDGELVWGHDDVARGMHRYLDSWDQYSFELEDIAEVTLGKVVGICRERGVDGNGVSVDRRFGGLWVVQRAKIASWSTFLSPKEAIRAARELGSGGFERPGQPAQRTVPAQRSAAAPNAAAAAAQPPPAAAEPARQRAPAQLSEQQRRAAKARAQLRRQAARS
jgi:hypothetical protein